MLSTMSDMTERLNAALEGREGGMASVCLPRGWSRGGGVFLVTATLLFASGCAAKGDVRRLQEEGAAQAALEEIQLQELAADIQALRELVEAQSAIAVDTQGGNARVFRDIQDQLSVLTQLVGQILRSIQRADPDSFGALVPRDGGDPAAAAETYTQAVTQYNRGSLNIAQMAFTRFLEEYPEDEQAADARFYLGVIHERENRLDEAIEEFLRVAQLHPLADRVPVALYRVGLIYVLQDNLDDAVIYFERVVASHPEHDAADLAREQLEDIR